MVTWFRMMVRSGRVPVIPPTESLIALTAPACFADRWRLAVLSAYPAELSGEVKVLLLLLYEAMNDDGVVSVAERDLTTLLKRNRSKVVTSIAGAIQAGYLARLVKGQRWRRAVYQAAIPEGDRDDRSRATPSAPARDRGRPVDAVPAAV